MFKRLHFTVAVLSATLLVASSSFGQQCPETSGDVANLNPFTACTVTYFLLKTPEQSIAIVATDEDDQCIAEKNSCAAATRYNKCQKTTDELLEFIVPAAIRQSVDCNSLFRAYPGSCNKPFGELVSLYCKDPPLLPVPAIIGIIAGGIFMISLCAFVCWRTRNSIRIDREIEEAVSFMGPLPVKNMQTTNPALIVPPQKSMYHGVEWNSTAGGWDSIYKSTHVKEWLGTFQTQEQAARRYDQRILELEKMGVTGNPLNFPPAGSSPAYAAKIPMAQDGSNQKRVGDIAPPPGLGLLTSRSTVYQDPDAERHIQELVHFYQVYDPDRQDIESHVIELFNKYRFKGIARAILRKYGVLPSGWSEEYDATRSIAMSMAARFFAPGQTQSGQIALPQNQSMAISRQPDF